MHFIKAFFFVFLARANGGDEVALTYALEIMQVIADLPKTTKMKIDAYDKLTPEEKAHAPNPSLPEPEQEQEVEPSYEEATDEKKEEEVDSIVRAITSKRTSGKKREKGKVERGVTLRTTPQFDNTRTTSNMFD